MLRVTQRTMYSTLTNQMNGNLSAYMESNIQGSTMKKVNKPSDDPAGMARILNYRTSIERITQLEVSSDTALGWLQLADNTLTNSVSTLLGSSILPLAEQAATSTVTAENRKQIAQQLREYLGTLINLANTRYEDKCIFGGQNYNGSAFVEGLAVSGANWGVEDPNDPDSKAQSPNPPFQVTGTLKSTALVRFPAGEGATENGNVKLEVDTTEYQYSLDGGKTWVTEDANGNPLTVTKNADGLLQLSVGGATLTLPEQKKDVYINTAVTDDEENFPVGDKNGTMLYVRPTAIYQGDDNQATPKVEQYGTVKWPSSIGTSVTGTFDDNTLIKLPDGVDMSTATRTVTNPDGTTSTVPNTFKYQYSTDSGKTWVTAEATVAVDSTATPNTSSARLLLPGGYMDITCPDINGSTATPPTATSIPSEAQLSLKPQRTDLSFTIMEGQTITVNNVGKDIFGGLYKPEYGETLEPMFGEDDGRNLFETLGRLIGYCETNNSQGIGQCLDDLKLSQKNILVHGTAIGGKENRLSATLQNLDDNKYDQQTRMSTLEDVNLTELMVRLTQQQMAYQTTLQSSSMIMGLSLANYI